MQVQHKIDNGSIIIELVSTRLDDNGEVKDDIDTRVKGAAKAVAEFFNSEIKKPTCANRFHWSILPKRFFAAMSIGSGSLAILIQSFVTVHNYFNSPKNVLRGFLQTKSLVTICFFSVIGYWLTYQVVDKSFLEGRHYYDQLSVLIAKPAYSTAAGAGLLKGSFADYKHKIDQIYFEHLFSKGLV